MVVPPANPAHITVRIVNEQQNDAAEATAQGIQDDLEAGRFIFDQRSVTEQDVIVMLLMSQGPSAIAPNVKFMFSAPATTIVTPPLFWSILAQAPYVAPDMAAVTSDQVLSTLTKIATITSSEVCQLT